MSAGWADKPLAQWLRARCADAGYDPDRRGAVSELAAEAGVDPAMLSRALRGLLTPTAGTALPLAAALGVDPRDLLLRIAAQQSGTPHPPDAGPTRVTPALFFAHVGLHDDGDRAAVMAVVTQLKAARDRALPTFPTQGETADDAQR